MNEARAEALRWYSQALDDRRFAQWLLSEERFFDKGCFVAQQAGEKVLKACLYAVGSRRVFGHSLAELCTELAAHHPASAEVADQAKRLDRHYIPTRYPNGLPGGTPFESFSRKDLADALQDLASVFAVCEAFLTARGLLTPPPPTDSPATA